jgi:hypothetical protein
MKADLIKGDRLIGKTRDEIIDMLGPADRDKPGPRGWVQYEIDSGRLPIPIVIARDYLMLTFDDDGSYVTKVSVVDA